MHDDELAVDSGDTGNTMVGLLKLIQALPRLVPLISLLKPGGDTTVLPSGGWKLPIMWLLVTKHFNESPRLQQGGGK